jgi:hypothetical protein
LKTVEKYTPKANIWQSLPSLNTARASASGHILSDHLYVFGGNTTSPSSHRITPLASIERLNLKRCLSSSTPHFEPLDVSLPLPLCDIGILPLYPPTDLLLLGGFSPSTQSPQPLSRLRFSAINTSLNDS